MPQYENNERFIAHSDVTLNDYTQVMSQYRDNAQSDVTEHSYPSVVTSFYYLSDVSVQSIDTCLPLWALGPMCDCTSSPVCTPGEGICSLFLRLSCTTDT